MRILDKYVVKSIIITFLSTVFIFACMYILIDVTSNLDEIIERKVPTEIMLKYYLNFFPIILVQTSSIAALISCLLTFSQLHNNNEVVAMRASGLGFWHICKPALMFALVVSMVVFWLNETFIPKASNNSEQIRNENIIIAADRDQKKKAKIENLTFYGLNNRLFFIDKFDPNNNELEGITLITYDENQNIKEKIVAYKGSWTGIAWKFSQCQITTYNTLEINSPSKLRFVVDKLMDIKETPEDFLKQRVNISSMNIRQLKEYISRFSRSGAVRAINNLKVDLYSKFAFPAGTFVIVLMGLPLAMMVKSRKGMTFTSLGIAIGIGFLFHVTNAVGLAFGKGGLLSPMIAAWIAPFLFAGIALLIIENNF